MNENEKIYLQIAYNKIDGLLKKYKECPKIEIIGQIESAKVDNTIASICTNLEKANCKDLSIWNGKRGLRNKIMTVPEGVDTNSLEFIQEGWNLFYEYADKIFNDLRKMILPKIFIHIFSDSVNCYMCDHLVTQFEYESIIGNNPCINRGRKNRNCPVENVNFYHAIAYCNYRSIKEGFSPCYSISKKNNPEEWGNVPYQESKKWNSVECDFTANGYRLPTVKEWEVAAKKDSIDLSNFGDYAWFDENSDCRTHEVKKKLPNDLGLFDMFGNVWEWTWRTDEQSVDHKDFILLGGCFGIGESTCVSYKNKSNASLCSDNRGFRVVRSVL